MAPAVIEPIDPHRMSSAPARASERPDPLVLLAQQDRTRLPWLVPERYSRMADNPFAFFQGAAAVMASDLARRPHSGLMVQLCGDAQLLNFGFYASPERQLLFDINDFDETHPGPFEWDLVRLATSLLLAARSLGLSEKQQDRICRRSVRAYGEAMADLARMPVQQMWVLQRPLKRLLGQESSACLRQHLKQLAATSMRRNSRQAVNTLCETSSSGELRIRHEPPLIWRFEELPEPWQAGRDWQQWASAVAHASEQNLSAATRRLLGHFHVVDSALKTVGVGSVGSRCVVSVLVGDHPDDVLVLEAKQAEPSVLAASLNAETPAHQGQRVVEGQQVMQTASDAFLGWGSDPDGHPVYVRHFRDWTGSVDLAQLDAGGLGDVGRLCGWTLAKAHARSGDRRAIATHIGEPKRFARAVLEQALEQATLAVDDHACLLRGIATGSVSSSAL